MILHRHWLYGRLWIYWLIELLDEDEKSVVNLKFYHDFTIKEVAETLNIPLGTAKTVLYRALKKLRIFQRAISKAEKINGILNYGVMFWMYLSFDDGTQEKYVLNVANEQGYTIPKDQTNELRKIIYND